MNNVQRGDYDVSEETKNAVKNLSSEYPWINGDEKSLPVENHLRNFNRKLGFLEKMYEIQKNIKDLEKLSGQSLEDSIKSIADDIKKIRISIKDFSPFEKWAMKNGKVFMEQLEQLETELHKAVRTIRRKELEKNVETAFNAVRKKAVGKKLKNQFKGAVFKNIADMLKAAKKEADNIRTVNEQLKQTEQMFIGKMQVLKEKSRSIVFGFTSFSSKLLNNREKKSDTVQRNMLERQLMEQFNDGMFKIQSLKQSFETTVEEIGKMLEQQFPNAKARIKTFCQEYLTNGKNTCKNYEETLGSALKTQINNL